MIIKLLRPLFICAFYLLCLPCHSSHMAGGSIRYTMVSKSKIVVYATIIRDCRGTALTSVSAGVFAGKNGSNGCGSYTWNVTRLSIADITPRCSTSGKPCTPQNTYGTGEGWEAHEYVFDTVDVSKTPFSTWMTNGNCSEINFYIGSITGRNGAITTGPAGNGMFVTLTLNLQNLYQCPTQVSQGPEWLSLPMLMTCCNQTVHSYAGAVDTDQDSTTFKLVPAKHNIPNTSVSYKSPFSYNYPLTPYCIPPTTIKCIPNTKTNPPRGFWMDTNSGMMIFTPVKCDEVSVVAIICQEYRKDTAGNYVLISSSTRDLQVVVKDDCGYNRPPTFYGLASTARVCAGDILNHRFQVKDETFTPYQTIPDTPTVSFTGNFPGGQIIYKDPKAREKEYTFQWQSSATSDFKSNIQLILLATDNHCQKPATTNGYSTISVYKKLADTLHLNVLADRCSAIHAAVTNDSLFPKFSYDWEIYNVDSARMYFKGTGGAKLHTGSLPAGKYEVSVTAYSGQTCARRSAVQMVAVSGIIPAVDIGKDTWMCPHETLIIEPQILNATGPYNFLWSYQVGPGTYFTASDSVFRIIKPNQYVNISNLEVTDARGCIFYSKSKFIQLLSAPGFDLGNDTTICETDSLILKGPEFFDYQYLWNRSDTSSSITVSTPGEYSLTVYYKNGCRAADSIIVSISEIPEITHLFPISYCNLTYNVDLNEFIFIDSVNPAKGDIHYKAYSFNSDTAADKLKNLILAGGNVFVPGNPFGKWILTYNVPVYSCPDQTGMITVNHHANPLTSFEITNFNISQDKVFVTFKNTTVSPDNTPLLWKWNFGGADPDSSVIKNPTAMYPYQTGNHKVWLWATSAYCSDSYSGNVFIANTGTRKIEEEIRITPDLRVMNPEFNVVELLILDASGRLMYRNTGNTGISESVLITGIYFYRITIRNHDQISTITGKYLHPKQP